VLEGRAGALRVFVGVDVLVPPPIFVTGSSVVVDVDDDDLDIVLFAELILPDDDIDDDG
jgi:hypothetical protein